MMSTSLGTLIAKMGLDNAPLQRGMKEAKTVMRRGLGQSQAALDKFKETSSGAFSGVKSSVFGLRDAFLSLGGALALHQYISMVDDLKLVEGRLRLVTSSTEDLIKVQGDLYDIATRARTGFSSTATLYTKLARSTKELGYDQNQLLQVTETISKAMIVSGASADEAGRAMIQLSQGLAAGVLRGQDLRSVIEQTPRLAEAIANGMGVTLGKLRELGEQGKITAQQVIKSLLSQKDVIENEFSQMPTTVGQALSVLNNEIGRTISGFDKELSLTTVLAQGVLKLSGAFRSLGNMSAESREQLASMVKELALFGTVSMVIPKVVALFKVILLNIASLRLSLNALPATLATIRTEGLAAAGGMKALSASMGGIAIALIAAVEAGRALSAWFDSMNQLTKGYKEGLEKDVIAQKTFAKVLKDQGVDLARVRKSFGSLGEAMKFAQHSTGRLGEAWKETQRRLREMQPTADNTGKALDRLKNHANNATNTTKNGARDAAAALRKMYGVMSRKDVLENLKKMAGDFDNLRQQGVGVKMVAASMNKEFLKQLKTAKEYGIRLPDSIRKVADEIGKNGYPQVSKLGDALSGSLTAVTADASHMTVVIRNASGEIAKTLSGGFGKGAEDGVKYGDQVLDMWREKIAREGVMVPLKPDDSAIRDWMAKFKQHGLGAGGPGDDFLGAVP